jgi:hypothetical protein
MKQCPYFETEPNTHEGWAAWRVLTTGTGQWRRADMSGAIIGLDMGECLARIDPGDGEPAIIGEILQIAESAAVMAMKKTTT